MPLTAYHLCSLVRFNEKNVNDISDNEKNIKLHVQTKFQERLQKTMRVPLSF